MRPRSFLTTVFVLLGVFSVLLSGGTSANASASSDANAREISRHGVMQQILARSDAFRHSAVRLGWDETSARQILTEGWDRLTNPPREAVIPEGSDAEFMLNALETLGDCEAVDRARTFVLDGCGREISAVALEDQFRRAALGSVEDETALKILAHWSADSAEAFLASVNDSRQPAPKPFDRRDFPSAALAQTSGSANDFHAFQAFDFMTQNPLDGVCVTQNARLPRLSFFSFNLTLSAGRKPFLLI
ncbi:MAG: hypothetical protein K6C40_10410 [Thermoguttaceae bacterium]|nr:hypothetical protein [Thermoguttaceae bacterium]